MKCDAVSIYIQFCAYMNDAEFLSGAKHIFIEIEYYLLVLVLVYVIFQAVLAAIVLVALKGLFKQFIVLKYLWKISKIDAVSDISSSS